MSMDRFCLVAVAISLYWAAVVNVAYCPTLLPGESSSTSWWVWVSCTLAHGIVAALCLRKLVFNGAAATPSVLRPWLVAACILADAGMLLLFLAPVPSLATEVCGAVLLGAGVAVVFVAWLHMLTLTDGSRLIWALSGWSHLGGLLLSSLTVALPVGMGRAATLAMIPAAALCLARAASHDDRREPEGPLPAVPGIPVGVVQPRGDHLQAPRTPLPTGMLLCCVLFCIPMGTFRSTNGGALAGQPSDWPVILAGSSLILGTVMLVDLLSPRLRESRFFYRLILPLLAGGILISVFLTNDAQTSGVLIVTATALFLAYVYYALGCLYDGLDRTSLPGVTLAVLALDFGMVAGAFVGAALRTTVLPTALELAMGLAYMLLLIGMWIVPRAFDWLSGFDVIARSERASERRGGLSIVRTHKAPAVSDEFARTWGLSEREREVAELLVGGNSIKAIARELGVSENTVKTHRQHAYAKLGVHGREELEELLARSEDAETVRLPN